MGNILIVEDDPSIRKLVRVNLAKRGYTVSEAEDSHKAISLFQEVPFDLVLLDLVLPGLSGVDVCAWIRARSDVPIIILSARLEEDLKVAALDAGADDYVTKPFSMGELLARLRAALRRINRSEDEPVLAFGELSIDLAHRSVTIKGEEVKLTPTEYEVLKYLAQKAGRVVTHRQLLLAVWGSNYQEQSQYLRVYIGQLRRKIEADPSQPAYIITEPGVGYRLVTRD